MLPYQNILSSNLPLQVLNMTKEDWASSSNFIQIKYIHMCIQWGDIFYCKAKFSEPVISKAKHKLFCMILIHSFPPTFQLFCCAQIITVWIDSWLLFRSITVHVLSRSWQHSEIWTDQMLSALSQVHFKYISKSWIWSFFGCWASGEALIVWSAWGEIKTRSK